MTLGITDRKASAQNPGGRTIRPNHSALEIIDGLSANQAPDEILQRSPKLVWCTITGFGKDSPRPGYDFVTQAECGWMAITGEPNGDPMKVGVALADVIAGKDAVAAILAALVARGQSGAGRRIFISLVDSARAAVRRVQHHPRQHPELRVQRRQRVAGSRVLQSKIFRSVTLRSIMRFSSRTARRRFSNLSSAEWHWAGCNSSGALKAISSKAGHSTTIFTR